MASLAAQARTDGRRGYEGLSSKGYDHVVLRQDAEVGDNLLPLLHRVAALLKRWLGGTHQGVVCASHLDYYLDEYTFRFSRRTSRSRGKLFYRLVQQVVAIGPVTAECIHGGGGGTLGTQDRVPTGVKRIPPIELITLLR